MKHIHSYTSGFTLLELMMAIFMFAVIAGGVTVFSAYYFDNYSFSFEENQSIGQAQTSLTTMIREIREARTGDDGSWPIVQADDASFTFYSDVTNDGRTDRVRYYLDGSVLKKGVIQPTSVPVTYPIVNESTSVITDAVDTNGGPIFRYYNGNWPSDQINNPLTQSARLLSTRHVEVYVRINISQNFAAQPFELSSGVTIRSLKDNL